MQYIQSILENCEKSIFYYQDNAKSVTFLDRKTNIKLWTVWEKSFKHNFFMIFGKEGVYEARNIKTWAIIQQSMNKQCILQESWNTILGSSVVESTINEWIAHRWSSWSWVSIYPRLRDNLQNPGNLQARDPTPSEGVLSGGGGEGS